MNRLLTLAALLAIFSAPALAQPVPAAYVPLAPCLLADATYPVGTSYLLVRGHCNVPAEASAVVIGAVADSAGTAGVSLYGSEIAWPGFVTMTVPTMESTSTTVRLCYPEPECRGEDLAVKVQSVPVHLQLSVLGYFIPL